MWSLGVYPPNCETLARFWYTPRTRFRKTANFQKFRVFEADNFSRLALVGPSRYIPFLVYCPPGILPRADFRYTTILAARLPSALEALTSEIALCTCESNPIKRFTVKLGMSFPAVSWQRILKQHCKKPGMCASNENHTLEHNEEYPKFRPAHRHEGPDP